MARSNKILTFFLVLTTISIVVIALVLPNGLNVNGTLEEYLVIGAQNFDSQRSILANDSQTALRPLALQVALFSYSITPDSYFGVNLFNYSLIIIKGILLFYILAKLNFSRSTALAIAILFTTYPTNATSLRLAVVVQAVTVTFLSALLLFIRLNTRWRWHEFILMSVFLAATTLMYEMPYMLILFAPALLLFVERKITRRILGLSFAWYTVAGLVALRWIYFYVNLGDSYQQGTITSVDNSPLTLLTVLFNAVRWNLVGVWYSTLLHLYNATPLYLIIATSASLFIFIVFIKLPWHDDTAINRQSVIKLLVAVIIIALGYAIFLVTNVRTSYGRVFGLSSIGSAIFMICVLHIVTSYLGKHKQLAFSFVFSGFIFLSLITGLRIRGADNSVAFQQQAIASDMLMQMPDMTVSAPTIVVFDETGELVRYAYLPRVVETPLQILYDNEDLNAFICYPNTTYGWQSETCGLQADGIFHEHNDVRDLFAYDNLIAFMYTADGRTELLQEIPVEIAGDLSIDNYDPSALICDTCSYPPNTNAYFTNFPFEIPQEGQPVIRNLRSFFR